MLGGIVLGTLLALMRLSGKPWLDDAGGGLRQHHAQHPAGDGDPVVLPAHPAADRPADGRRVLSAIITFTLFEAAYYCEIMRAGIQSSRAARCTPATRWA
jgi:glutamate/aspartate transport system permease protein